MLDAEYVLRFFAIKQQWESFPGNMRIAMDIFMKDYQNPREAKLLEFKKSFNDAIGIAEKIWGKYAFMRPEGTVYRNQLVQGLYDVQTVPISIIPQTKHGLIIEKASKIKALFLKEYNEDIDFQNSIRQFTSNPERLKYRIKKMVSLIKQAISE